MLIFFILFLVFNIFCITISYFTLLLIVERHAIPLDFGIAINPIPVRDKVIEIDVVVTKTNVSNDFNNVVNVLNFLYHFLDLLFLSLKYVIISLLLLIDILKLMTSFNFFLMVVLNQYFQKVRLGIIDHIFGPLKWHRIKQIFPRKSLFQYDKV